MSKLYPFITKRWRPLHAKIAFTALVFTPVILLGYFFASNIVHKNMINRAENMINFERMIIEVDLMEPSTALGIFSEAVRDMIMNGDSIARIKSFFAIESAYLDKKSEFTLSNFKGFYGYLKTLQGDFISIDGMSWMPNGNDKPNELPWYKTAVKARGKIGESQPHYDNESGDIIFSYSRCIYDDKNKILGVISLDVQINDIGKHLVDAALEQGGYGVLLSQNLTVLAHPNKPFVGLTIGDSILPLSVFKEELEKGEEITERKMISYDNKESIVFFKKLSNGWHLGIVTPYAPFFRDVIKMTVGMALLGALFAAVLILILIRLDKARRKATINSRHKSVFLANMSHEMRTPMNAIIGMTAIGKLTTDIQHKDYCLSKIDNASQHLLGVINDILDMSKIEANKFELSYTEFNFEKMIQQTVSVIEIRMEEKQHKFTLSIDSAIPKNLIGDDQRLSQVITNLLGNALKFTKKHGSIHLDARVLSEENDIVTIQVTVKDSGIGISKEQQQKLFSAFQQADSNMTRKYGGTGLGLAICKNIVEMMGGSIWVDSEPGKGSTFGFTVNLHRGEDKISQIEEDQLNNYSGIFSGHRILLVEDVEINREIVTTLLEPTKIEIDSAGNGLEAVNKFHEAPDKYDLILMDLQMPEMDGYSATQQIRSLKAPRAKTIPIIALTANVFREDIERCLKAGMNSHLGKPFDLKEIIKKMWFYLD